MGLEVSVARVRSLGCRVDTRSQVLTRTDRTEHTRIGWDGMNRLRKRMNECTLHLLQQPTCLPVPGLPASLERFNEIPSVSYCAGAGERDWERLGDCWASAGRRRDALLHKAKDRPSHPPSAMAASIRPHARSTYRRRAQVAAAPEVQVGSFEGSFAVHTVLEVLLLLLTCGLVLAPLLS